MHKLFIVTWGCGALDTAMTQLSLLSRSVRINVVFEEVNMKVLQRQGCRYARYSAFVGCGGLGWAGWLAQRVRVANVR